TRPLQCLKCRDRRHQFHTVIGGMRLAAVEFLFVIAESEDRAPAARPRIARTGAVGVDGDALLQITHGSIPYSRTLLTDWWKRSLPKYSNGSFGLTSAPSGTASQSTSLVSRNRMAAPRARTGSAPPCRA